MLGCQAMQRDAMRIPHDSQTDNSWMFSLISAYVDD